MAMPAIISKNTIFPSTDHPIVYQIKYLMFSKDCKTKVFCV